MKRKPSAVERSPDSAPMTQQRRSQIVDLAHQQGSVRVAEMAERFGVSEVTIRNDLDQLEREGRITRDRGGALPTGITRSVHSLPDLEHRSTLNPDAKRRIAAAAARRVQAGQSLILDAGTTTVEMIRHLASIPNLTIVTNALNIALSATVRTDARVLMLGGAVGRDSGSTLGGAAIDMLSTLVVDHLFLGAQAVDLEHGLTDTNIEIAQVKRCMIQRARRITLLMDSSKWQTSGFIKVAPLTAVHTLITDSDLSQEALQALQNLNIEVEMA